MDDFQQDTSVIDQTLMQLRANLVALENIAENAQDDMDVYRAARQEKSAIDDKISKLLNLEIVQETAAMQGLLPDMKQATSDLNDVVGKICKASDVVDKVTKILGVVDLIVAAAKTVA